MPIINMERRSKLFSVPITFFIVFCFNAICYGQIMDPNPASTHEKWEYVLEDTGDVLQMAIPAAGLITTIAKKRLARHQTMGLILWYQFDSDALSKTYSP